MASSSTRQLWAAEEQIEEKMEQVRQQLALMRRRDVDMRSRLDDMKQTIQDIDIEVRSQLEVDRSRPGSVRRSENGRASLASAGSYNGSEDRMVVSPSGSITTPLFSFTPATPPTRRRRPWSSADNLTDTDTYSESGGEDTPDTESVSTLSPLVFDTTSIRSTASDNTHARMRHSLILPGEFSVPGTIRSRSRSNEFPISPTEEMRSRASSVVTPARRPAPTLNRASSESTQKKGRSWVSNLIRRITTSESRKSRRSLDSKKVSN